MPPSEPPNPIIETFNSLTPKERAMLEHAAELDRIYGGDVEREVADHLRGRGDAPPAWRKQR